MEYNDELLIKSSSFNNAIANNGLDQTSTFTNGFLTHNIKESVELEKKQNRSNIRNKAKII